MLATTAQRQTAYLSGKVDGLPICDVSVTSASISSWVAAGSGDRTFPCRGAAVRGGGAVSPNTAPQGVVSALSKVVEASLCDTSAQSTY